MRSNKNSINGFNIQLKLMRKNEAKSKETRIFKNVATKIRKAVISDKNKYNERPIIYFSYFKFYIY